MSSSWTISPHTRRRAFARGSEHVAPGSSFFPLTLRISTRSNRHSPSSRRCCAPPKSGASKVYGRASATSSPSSDQTSASTTSETPAIYGQRENALEWEILDGVMLVDERENIAPGFVQRLLTTLAPGDFAITCGLLGYPRGKLHVGAPAG